MIFVSTYDWASGCEQVHKEVLKHMMSLDNSINLGLRYRIFNKSNEERVFLCCSYFSKILSLR